MTPTSVKEFSDGECFAILFEERVDIPGDERSRTHPGHGYPAHSKDYWSIQVFANQTEWEEEIKRLSGLVFLTKSFKPVRMFFPKVTTKIQIDVE